MNRHGWPMQNLEIKAHVVDWQLAPSVVRDLPFCSRTLAAGDDSMGNAKACRYNLAGASAKTDRDGVATFSELFFDSRLPGGYRLEFFAERSLLNVTEWMTVKPSVAQVIVDESYTAERAGGDDLVFDSAGLPMPLKGGVPKVRIVTPSSMAGLKYAATRGSGALMRANLTVFAINLDADRDLGGDLLRSIRISPNPEQANIPNNHVVLVGNEALVDSNGVASFPNLAVAGYDRPYLLLAFVCQGQVLVWSQSQPPATYNVSEHAAARGGLGAFPTIAYTVLPAPPTAVVADGAKVAPKGVQSAFSVTEGAAFGLEMQHESSLAGAALVAKLTPIAGASVDTAVEDTSAEESGVKLLVPTYHKLLLGSPPAILLTGGISLGGFRSSPFGRPGKYKLELVLMGVVVYVFDLTVLEAVEMLTPGALPDSPVLCGVKQAPVCRHDNGECSFGKVAGNIELPLSSGTVCDGIHVLTGYSSSGDGVLPWVETEGKETAGGGTWPTNAKLLAIEMVPWGVDVLGLSANQTRTPVDQGVVTSSRVARLTGRYGSGSISGMKLLVVPPAVKFLQPVLRMDTQLYPLPIKVAVTNHVPKAATNCGVRSCTHIQTVVPLPGLVMAGETVWPAPQAKVVDAEGSPLPNIAVCLVYGSAEHVQRHSDHFSAALRMINRHTLEPVAGALKDIASEQFLCNQGAVQGLRCTQMRAALADFGCALTDASGVATLNNLKLHSDVKLSQDLTVWRFVAANAFPDMQISCLNTYSSWLPICRSPLMSVKVLNRIQRIEAVSGAGVVVGTVVGQRVRQFLKSHYVHLSSVSRV